ncbi:uncharacterized protein [Medicago truncatula]|uniref:uncharacterized protein isoform X1 n=1 Tax=Medicago truncatula TaxID=3880 RepID=UPI001967B010|nr:uncharacterized protein LOC25483361 isoform X1 [Medicago truncatula]XP_039682535.1 uncharacterized protein LOC25483361 isoform X1 [Medicago truncatula]
MSKEEIEKYLNQDMKNIEYFKQDMKKYQPGVFEPGLVPDMYISEEKQDVKKQRREDAMRLSVLRFKFKSRANQLIAKKNEVEKMPRATTNLLLAEKPLVTTNPFLAVKPPVTANSLLAEKPPVTTNPFLVEMTHVTTNSLLAVKPPVTANSLLSEKPPVTTNPVLNFYHAKKQEVEKVAVNQKVEGTEFESGVITNELMSKEEIEKYLNQDMKNIEYFKEDMKKYQPGVFEPGLVPDMYISKEKQDVKKQRREDAMRLSALRFKFKSRANQLIAKMNEVEKMTTNSFLLEMTPVTTNYFPIF